MTKGRGRRWRRRLLKIGLVIAGLVILLRIGIAVALPYVIHGVLGPRLAVEYESLDLSILSGRVELSGLELRPVAESGSVAAEPVVRLDYALVDVDVTSLLGARPRVHRIELDGLVATLERDADGSLALARLIGGDPTSAPNVAAEPVVEPDDESGPIDLQLPVEVGSLRVHGATVQLIDSSVSPAVDLPVHVQLRVTDLGSPTERGNVEVFVWSPDALQRFRVQVDGTSGERTLAAEVKVDFSGLRPTAIAGYLQELGIAPHARELSFELATSAQLEPHADDADAVSAALDVRDLALRADGRDVLAVAEVVAVIERWSRRGLLGKLGEVRGLRGHAELLESGAFRIGGVDLLPSTGPVVEPVAVAVPAGEPGVLEFAQLAVRDVGLELIDHTVEPVAALELAIDEVTASNFISDPSRPDEPVEISVAMSAPGIAESVRVTGSARPFASELSFDAQLGVTGIVTERVAPYLRDAGFVSELSNAALALHVRGSLATEDGLRGEAHIDDLRLVDDHGERLAIDRLAVKEITIDSERARLGDVAFRGLRGPLRWDVDHHFHVFGMRTGASAPESTVTPPVDPPAVASTEPGPRFEVGRLRILDSAVRFRDEGVDPAFDVTAEPDLEISNFVLGDVEQRASLNIKLAAPPLAEALSLTGQVGLEPSPLRLNAEIELSGSGVLTEQLRGYLDAIRIRPTFDSGALTLGARARLHDDGSSLQIDAGVSDLAVSSGGEPLFSADGLAVDALRVTAEGVRIETATLRAPCATVVRDADGQIAVGGTWWPERQSSADDEAAVPVPAATPATDAARFILNHVSLTGGRVEWRDDYFGETRDGVGMLDADVHDIVTGPTGPPMRFSVRLSEPKNVDELTLEGQLTSKGAGPRLTAKLAASGLRRGPLVSYLGLEVELEDGTLAGEFDARTTVAEDGSRSVELDVKDFNYREGGAADALLGFDALKLSVPRIDPASRRYVIAEATVQGLEMHAHRTAGGDLRVFGLVGPTPNVSDPVADEPPVRRPRRPVEVTLPTELRIEKLDLDLAKLSVSDARLPNRPPFEVSARIRNPSTLLLHPEPDTATPLELDIEGRIDDVVDKAQVALRGAPFAVEPRLELDVVLAGVRGDRVADLLPKFAGRISSPLTEAVVRTKIRTQLDQLGQSPTIIDVQRAFGLDLLIDGFELLERPDGELIAGFEGVHVSVERFRPTTGDLHIRSIELYKPQGRVVRDEDGVHMFGVILQPDPDEEAATDGAVPSATSSRERVAAEAASGGDGPEFRVDELLINDIDVFLADLTTEPDFLLPLNDMSLEVRRFVYGGPGDVEPFQFRVQLGAGQVELPKRGGGSGRGRDAAGVR